MYLSLLKSTLGSGKIFCELKKVSQKRRVCSVKVIVLSFGGCSVKCSGDYEKGRRRKLATSTFLISCVWKHREGRRVSNWLMIKKLFLLSTFANQKHENVTGNV